jgi:AcrR family transcriptional regulator
VAAPTTTREPGTTGSRQRVLDAALRLFTQHSFAGTSLQMIADELGVTKAAVYHHFHTREELLTAVVEPLHQELRAIIDAAETLRTPHARAEHVLSGFAGVAVRNRDLISVLAADPSVVEMLRTHPDLGDLVDRQIKLLADVNPGPAGVVSAGLVMAGIAGAARPVIELDDETLCRYLVDAGRRALGLRAPRRRGGC